MKKRRLESEPALPEMEEELSSWIENLRSSNFKVTHTSVTLELTQANGKNCLMR